MATPTTDQFIVPETGTYTHDETGTRRFYSAGTLVNLRLAVHYQMPGAALPDPPFDLTDFDIVGDNGITTAFDSDVYTITMNDFYSAGDTATFDLTAGTFQIDVTLGSSVTITNPQEGDVLTFVSGGWINQAPA